MQHHTPYTGIQWYQYCVTALGVPFSPVVLVDPRSAMEGACPSTAAAAVPPPAMRRIQSIIPRVYGESLRGELLENTLSKCLLKTLAIPLACEDRVTHALT